MNKTCKKTTSGKGYVTFSISGCDENISEILVMYSGYFSDHVAEGNTHTVTLFNMEVNDAEIVAKFEAEIRESGYVVM